MNVVEEIKQLFTLTEFFPSERMKVFQCQTVILATQLPDYGSIVRFISNMPDRDTWEITLSTISGEVIRFSRNNSNSEKEYEQFVSLQFDDSSITINISAKKNIVNNKISIYCFASFVEEMVQHSIMETMEFFSSILDGLEELHFITYDSEAFFSTNTLVFSQNEETIRAKTISRQDRLQRLNSTSFFLNAQRIKLIPDDFSLDLNFDGNPLADQFNTIRMVLSISSIASTVSIENNSIHGQILGHRNVEFSYALNQMRVNDNFYDLYNWVYTDGNAADKVILVRNVLSLHCRYAELLEIDRKIFATVLSNYELYLRDNVDKYIQLKERMAEFICSTISKYGDYARDILGSFGKNLLALFVFLMSVVLTNIVSTRSLSDIFTSEVILILEIVILGSIMYMIACLLLSFEKIKQNRQNYNLLKGNYADVLSTLDLDDAFKHNEIIDNAEKDVKQHIKIYTTIWILFLVILIIIIESSQYSTMSRLFPKAIMI